MDGCIEWSGPRNDDGYGRVSINGMRHYAHRVAWVQAHGPIPDGLCVLHRCDNPPCCNVAHLFLGTRRDNAKDRHRKGRTRTGHLTGSAHGMAKLDEESVAAIRRKRAEGKTIASIGKEYGVSDVTVSLICRRKTWRQSP